MSAHHSPDLEKTTSKANPKPVVDLRAFGSYDCWKKQSRHVGCLVLRRASPGGRTLTSDIRCPFSGTRALTEWPFTSPDTQKPRMDTSIQTRFRQRNGDHAQGSRRRSVSPSPTNGNREREAENARSGSSGRRWKMRKADRLSKRYCARGQPAIAAASCCLNPLLPQPAIAATNFDIVLEYLNKRTNLVG